MLFTILNNYKVNSGWQLSNITAGHFSLVTDTLKKHGIPFKENPVPTKRQGRKVFKYFDWVDLQIYKPYHLFLILKEKYDEKIIKKHLRSLRYRFPEYKCIVLSHNDLQKITEQEILDLISEKKI